MPDETLQDKVKRLDGEMSKQLSEIVALERKVSVLTEIIRNFVVYCSSIQQISQPQEDAFGRIQDLLKQLEQMRKEENHRSER
jgi:hypothetical protein